jgi:Sel1 repeat
MLRIFTLFTLLLLVCQFALADQALDAALVDANNGDANAQATLGAMYHNCQGVTQDFTQALRWSTKAAEQGHAEGQFYLGLMYDAGEGVTQDNKQALRWYTEAASQGNAMAQYNLGVMVFHGRGIASDHNGACRLFALSAANGFEPAIKSRDFCATMLTPTENSTVQQGAADSKARCLADLDICMLDCDTNFDSMNPFQAPSHGTCYVTVQTTTSCDSRPRDVISSRTTRVITRRQTWRR